MYSLIPTLLFSLLCFRVVNAGLWVVNPLQGSTCQANQPCTVTWLDDGEAPLLTAIGVTTVGLFTGLQQLVQTIPPVNVATEPSLTFTPNPKAGPDANNYYVAFVSTTLKNANGSAYVSYSPFFTLSGMSGSFNSPLPAATSPIPIPSSLTRSQGPSSTSTSTVGILDTIPVTGSTTSTGSKSSATSSFTTILSSPSSSSSSSSSTSPTSSSSPSKSRSRGSTIHLASSFLLSSSLSLFLLLLNS